MTKRPTKAIITCGGYATRFLPISKAIPKEMMPIGAKPVIHYIVEELVSSGITDIMILLGRGKACIADYFDKNFEIDTQLEKTNSNIKTNFFDDINISFRRVPMPRGAADCIMFARDFVAGEPFVIAYGDDVFFDGNPTCELIADFEKQGLPVITTFRVLPRHASAYGIIEKGAESGEMRGIIEKPAGKPSSLLAAVGRYLMTPQIFNLIAQDAGQKEEICMTRQLNKLAGEKGIRYITTKARRFDTGVPRGLYNANKYYFDELHG